MKKRYDHSLIEKKWQKKWEEEKLYSPDIKIGKNKFYNLWMFPYPSAEGLHAGHAFASTGSDIFGRYMRMSGRNVFQPFIGYDSFGIHSENYALEVNEHPMELVKKTTKHYGKQMQNLGHGYDWTRTVTTSDIDYYRWTQWLFVQLFKAGLAYRKKAEVNWCPSCQTVLADEQVMTPAQAGKEAKGIKKGQNKENIQVCERCGYIVERKELTQWFFRITDYADRLLKNLKKIDWSPKVKLAQKNWIGKSEGAIIKFAISNSQLAIESFTTRPDTLFGATFFVLSPEHPQINDLTTSKYKESVQKYVEKSKQKTKEDRIAENKEKTGVFTGGYVINPANNKKIPVYVADYVLMDYGTGAIMGVPAHDQRDWAFAKKEGLKIVKVVSGPSVKEKFHDEAGKLINSEEWNGLKVPEEMGKVISFLEKKGWGKKITSYHLRDWLISRQRYWGTPIPMVFCQSCADSRRSWFTSAILRHAQDDKSDSKSLSDLSNGSMIHNDQSDWDHAGWWPEENLPVELPFIEDYKPKGEGKGPLADHPEFYKVACPECGGAARRETDVSDTFLDSAWYFLRYPSVGSQKSKVKSQNYTLKHKSDSEIPWDSKITRQWLPVDLYFGGAEHSVLHLMYSRFMTMVLKDLDYLDFEEPFTKFFAHGLMIKDGAKMSKSRGNVVNPDEYIDKYGADTLRLYLMFMGPMDGYPDFRDEGIEGMRKFIDKVWNLFQTLQDSKFKIQNSKQFTNNKLQISNKTPPTNYYLLTTKLHQTIKKVTEDIQKFHYNTAISAMMEYVNVLRTQIQNSKLKTQNRAKTETLEADYWHSALETLVLLLAPFAPHMAEEVWQEILGKKTSIHQSQWPKYDPKYIKTDTVTIAVQVNGKLRATLNVKSQMSNVKDEVIKLAKEDKKVQKWLVGKGIKREIFVPGRLVNFVVT